MVPQPRAPRLRPLTGREYYALNHLASEDFRWGHQLMDRIKAAPPGWVITNPLAAGGVVAIPIIQGMLDKVTRVFRSMPTRPGQPFPRMDPALRGFMIDFFNQDIDYWRRLGVREDLVDAFESALRIVAMLPRR